MTYSASMERFVKSDCKFLFRDIRCGTIPSFFGIVLLYSLRYRGDKNDTRGTAFVIYEDIYDAKAAVDHLSGFNVCGRYLIVLYYQPAKMNPGGSSNLQESNEKKKQEIDAMRNQFGL